MSGIENPILLDLPMPIITPRLKIVMADPKYAAQLLQAKEESMDVLRPWMIWAKDGAGTLDEQREMLIRAQARFILREDLMMLALTHDDEFVVATGIHKFNWRVPRAMIGYWAKKSAHGKGYVTEATNALLRYGFGHIGLRKIEVYMDSENTASENVAKRLNMTKEYESRGRMNTLHDDQLDRIEVNYCCYGVDDLPPLDVTW